MKQIARRLTRIPPLSVQAYLRKWQSLEKIRALERQRTQPDSAPVRFRLPPQRAMSPPVSGPKKTLWDRQNGRCQYCCGSLLPRYHVDHIHPKAKGGPNHLSNYCLACQPCNHAKRDHSVMDFVLSLLA